MIERPKCPRPPTSTHSSPALISTLAAARPHPPSPAPVQTPPASTAAVRGSAPPHPPPPLPGPRQRAPHLFRTRPAYRVSSAARCAPAPPRPGFRPPAAETRASRHAR
eukprot:ctg_706.g380